MPLTPLAEQIALYRLDREAAERRAKEERLAGLSEAERAHQKRRSYWIDALEETEFDRDMLIGRRQLKRREQQRSDDARILADLLEEPKFIRQPLLNRIDYLRKKDREESTRQASAFLKHTVEKSLARLEIVRGRQLTPGFRYMAGRERLDPLLRLAELSQKEVRLQATMMATHMDMLFVRLLDETPAEELTPRDILGVYHIMAADAMRLRVTPPRWHALGSLARRRTDIPYDQLPGGLARLRCADWWYGKLWHLRCEWREEQLRAVCQVSKAATAFISHDALIHKREQRRRMREFAKAHELVNDDGLTLEMEDVILSSNSNPRNRRNEMMATAKGLHNLAELRGDCGVFYTITCPSRFHATLESGLPNPKWTHRTVRESSDYLVDLFAGIRKKLHRLGLRWYGVRGAEPHHDGTVHWHMLCFMRKKDRKAITAVLRNFAIREDRKELGRNIKPRFDAVLMTKSKGDPVAYFAAYIGKNVDGQPLKNKVDKKTGEPMRSDESDKPIAETVENAVAWASLHRVRQFQFFGIPSRQAYRELRLLAGQLQRKLKPKKGAQLLQDKKMDDVMAAADAGCVATYILRQGGVLIPRKYHTVRTAYTIAEKPNTYGEHGTQIYGVWSPRLGPESRICTHDGTWQLVRKKAPQHAAGAAGGGESVDLQGGPTAPWTRGNNCPQGQITDKNSAKPEQKPPPECADFEQLGPRQRRALLERIRNQPPAQQNQDEKRDMQRQPTVGERALAPEMAQRLASIEDFAASLQLQVSQAGLRRLVMGEVVDIEGQLYRACADGTLYRVQHQRKPR
ncbi:replication endonuclease [Serratia marcescens]